MASQKLIKVWALVTMLTAVMQIGIIGLMIWGVQNG
jgi:hypothetical protein